MTACFFIIFEMNFRQDSHEFMPNLRDKDECMHLVPQTPHTDVVVVDAIAIVAATPAAVDRIE